jgi:acyl carrier protein
MNLMSVLEKKFKIEMNIDDIVDFSSYEKGKKILKKYKIAIK